MIRLTRLNHASMVLNSDLIEHIDVTPDTVITLTTGQILRVRETADQVIRRIVEFRRRIFGGSSGRCEGEPDGQQTIGFDSTCEEDAGKEEAPASGCAESVEQTALSDRLA